MHTFILLSGETLNFERFMQGPKLSEGCRWVNAYEKVWIETKGEVETVDPNTRTLFGYDEAEFLAKQYRC